MSTHNVITREINSAPDSAADFKTSGIKADVIAESTSANGVVVDSVTLKDGSVTCTNVTASGRIRTNDGTSVPGFNTGAGGAVTQETSASTGVTLSKPCGQITTVALTTAAAAEERFTVTNTLIGATDVVILSTTYNGNGTPMLQAVNVSSGSFDIVITNVHASAALNAVMVINFVVFKAVAA